MKNKLFLVLAMGLAFAAVPAKGSPQVVGAAALSVVGNMAALNWISAVMDGGLLREQKLIYTVGAITLASGLPVFETKCMARTQQEKAVVFAVDALLGCCIAYTWEFLYPGTFKSPVRVGLIAGALKAVGGLMSLT